MIDVLIHITYTRELKYMGVNVPSLGNHSYLYPYETLNINFQVAWNKRVLIFQINFLFQFSI